MEGILFPYEKIRKAQDELISEVKHCVENKKSLIVHAPTGLGKTIASIGPSLAYALKKKLTVFFLTARQTQHRIVIDTLKEIKKKTGAPLIASDIIGKQSMCIVPAAEALYSTDFSEYCKDVREKGTCEFYVNTVKKSGRPTVKAESLLSEFLASGPYHTEEVIEMAKKEKMCPYELAVLLASKSNVIIADYYYVFSPHIRNTFFGKAGKELETSIVIIDEGHNLPKRCRDLMTQKISTVSVGRAIKEARKYGYSQVYAFLEELNAVLINYYSKEQESLIPKEDFTERIKSMGDYYEIVGSLEAAAEDIREKQRQSSLGAIAEFLIRWEGPDEGFARILQSQGNNIFLTYRCLNPSLLTAEVVNKTHSTILMSGTLTPTSMYRDILGFENSVEKELKSPFPKKNRLNIIIPETTTRYAKRSEEQFGNIGKILKRVIKSIPGNTAVFFPSYDLRNKILYYLTDVGKEFFLEKQGMSKEEKKDLIDSFKKESKGGNLLLGAATGSFGEGIDLPGDLLRAVIIVGLPLEKPNLENRKLIEYYDAKFGKGWDYGYIFPAITKTLQNAGRCIRSESDKGVIVFLEERYSWPNYLRCFPPDMEFKITKEYEKEIREFFGV